MTASTRLRQPLVIVAALTLTACSDGAIPATAPKLPTNVAFATASADDNDQALGELRRATARYHNVEAAIADGFFPVVEECEARAEGRVGIPYANLSRLLDGKVDPSLPDALLYEPSKNGHLKLVAAEFAIPYPLWGAAEAPEFLGVQFQREDELGVYALHIWLWRQNPNGIFAVANPNVSCEATE